MNTKKALNLTLVFHPFWFLLRNWFFVFFPCLPATFFPLEHPRWLILQDCHKYANNAYDFWIPTELVLLLPRALISRTCRRDRAAILSENSPDLSHNFMLPLHTPRFPRKLSHSFRGMQSSRFRGVKGPFHANGVLRGKKPFASDFASDEDSSETFQQRLQLLHKAIDVGLFPWWYRHY